MHLIDGALNGLNKVIVQYGSMTTTELGIIPINVKRFVVLNSQQLKGQRLYDEPMSKHTSWRVGGPARVFYKPKDLQDLSLFLQQLPTEEPLLWLGLGSNLLVRDGGFAGTVVLTTPSLKEIKLLDDGKIYVQSGMPCAKFARFAADHNLQGGEFFCGIPGTMGGALAMNAGAFGGETWDVVVQAQMIRHSGEIVQRLPDEFEVAYRHVKGNDNEWFSGAIIQLQPGDGEQSRRQMKALLKKRGDTQPTQWPNAGSVFRNPPGDHAARLVEACGLKGHRIGAASVSSKHANFIINEGGASALHIESLIKHIRQTVFDKFQIWLEPEVRIVGEERG